MIHSSVIETKNFVKIRVFWDVAPCSQVDVDRRFRDAYCHHHQIALTMEAVRTSETLVNINLTLRRYIPEDSKSSYSPP
jgi:uncharacterized protein (DUF305 family)